MFGLETPAQRLAVEFEIYLRKNLLISNDGQFEKISGYGVC